MGQIKRGILLIILLIAVALFSMHVTSEARQPQGVGGGYEIIITANAQAGSWYAPLGFGGHRLRTILGQRFVGVGYNNARTGKVKLGYMSVLNRRPVINNTYIRANSSNTWHPYTNDTLACEINITDKDPGDRLNIRVTWYRNATSWYRLNDVNSLNRSINDRNIQDIVDEYGVTFERWDGDNETINHTIVASTFFSTNTTPHNRTWNYLESRSGEASLEPSDIDHYDIWMCSVDVFDKVAHSGWSNSTPVMIFNHRPDYNDAMPTYYEWSEDTTNVIDLGTNFSDIDSDDDINWYINWTSGGGAGRFTIEDITVLIDNVTGRVTLIPDNNITGQMQIIFSGVDYNTKHSDDWHLWNDNGITSTSTLTFNVTQINDRPWVTDVYVRNPTPGFTDSLICEYEYHDLENHEENTTATSYRWFIQDEGVGGWVNLDVNSSTLSPSYFDYEDNLACSVKVKDIYYDWNNIDMSLWSIAYVDSAGVVIDIEDITRPTGEGEIVIGVG